MSPAENAAFVTAQPSEATYTGPPQVSFPVLPLQGFGMQYAADIVFVTRHPDWDMHEYALLKTPERSVWIAKDSNQQGQQTIMSDLPDLRSWLPEIPAPRVETNLNIQDHSEGDRIDLALAYTNPSGDAVQIEAKGVMPGKPPSHRNGNTMGHSRDVVAVVLDIERFGSRLQGSMSIGGEPQKFSRIAGLVPFRFLLKQTQSGVAVTNFRQTGSDEGFTLTRPSPADPVWPTEGTEGWSVSNDVATWDNGICSYENTFNAGGLQRLIVQQHGVEAPTFTLLVEPALPDLRRRFEGVHRSFFRMDVNGQQGHGRGYIDATWTEDGTVHVLMVPTEPRWLADRPMETVITYQSEGVVDVRTRRVDDLPDYSTGHSSHDPE